MYYRFRIIKISEPGSPLWAIMGGEEDNQNDLPYRSEYAKSGRAKCKGCKVEIPKGDLRLASMTQVILSEYRRIICV